MKLLCFQAKRFRWKTHSKTLPDVVDQDIDQEVYETVVTLSTPKRPTGQLKELLRCCARA